MNKSNTIGDRIRNLRITKGETQVELAKALVVKRETVNQWENEARDLKTLYTVLLAKHFETTCDYILRGIESQNISVHEKTGLSDKAIEKLYRNNFREVYFNPDKHRTSLTRESNESVLVGKNYFNDTVDVLIKDNTGIIDDISIFLFNDFINKDSKHPDQINLKQRDSDDIVVYPVRIDEIMTAFLVNAQAKIINLKNNLNKGDE